VLCSDDDCESDGVAVIQAWLLRQLPLAAILTAILVAILWGAARLKEQGRAEMRPVIERLQSELESERAARIRNEEAVNAYVSEIEGLRKRPRPSTPVRLCIAAPQADLPALAVDDSTSIAGSGTELSGGNLVSGPDIGPALRELAYGCDAENAKLRALQNWVKSWVN